ncbi:MAG: hypothetical protein ACKO6Q_03720 [Bacteroidota bacterium]
MRKFILITMVAVCMASGLQAQHIRVRLDFPLGAADRHAGVAPFSGAVWIGPEWRWQHGQYVHVPGYWAKPKRFGARWVPGHWKHTRRGFIWVPGRWR